MFVFMYKHCNTAQGNGCTINITFTFTTRKSFCQSHTKMDIKHTKDELLDMIQWVCFKKNWWVIVRFIGLLWWRDNFCFTCCRLQKVCALPCLKKQQQKTQFNTHKMTTTLIFGDESEYKKCSFLFGVALYVQQFCYSSKLWTVTS